MTMPSDPTGAGDPLDPVVADYLQQVEAGNSPDRAQMLAAHPNIRFVSLSGVDLGGNETDERIPASTFLADAETLLTGGVQTDGSSVVLPGIATLNDGKAPSYNFSIPALPLLTRHFEGVLTGAPGRVTYGTTRYSLVHVFESIVQYT